MLEKKKTILLWARGRKRGIPAYEEDYMIVRDFIIETLRQEKELVLTDLIERAHIHLADKFTGDIGWYVLNVKQDLETQGLIRIVQGIRDQRFPTIKLTRKVSIAGTYL